MTFRTSVSNIVFCFLKQLETTVLTRGAENFPLSTLWETNDPEIAKLERMGGLLSHLLSTHDKTRLTQLCEGREKPSLGQEEDYLLFNDVLMLFNYVVNGELGAAVRGVERFVWFRTCYNDRRINLHVTVTSSLRKDARPPRPHVMRKSKRTSQAQSPTSTTFSLAPIFK